MVVSQLRRAALFNAEMISAATSGWSKSELELMAAVERGGLDRLLAGASAIGLLHHEGANWSVCEPLPRLAMPLKELLEITRHLPDDEIPGIAKRTYRKRS